MVPLERKRKTLINFFRANATVLDVGKGYISAPWVNQQIDARQQGFAADLIANHFRGRVDIIAGIPICGIPLATAVAERMPKVKLILPRKDNGAGVYPSSWGQDVIVTDTSRSFTTGAEGVKFFFPPTVRNKRLLLIDDFCALGDTACAIIPSLRGTGAEVSYAVYVAKIFQGGLGRIQQLGVKTFACIDVERITRQKKLIIRE